jgi:ribA/ribD-fused uncharacterized protein
MHAITHFDGEYDWLSNFYAAPIKVNRIVFPTNEHAFVYCKTLDQEDQKKILATASPGSVKRLGRKVKLRPDWLHIRVETMLFLVRTKYYQHPQLREKLLATGSMDIIEGNTWNDQFWGVCRGVGQNHLGRIHMHVRNEIRAGQYMPYFEGDV